MPPRPPIVALLTATLVVVPIGTAIGPTLDPTLDREPVPLAELGGDRPDWLTPEIEERLRAGEEIPIESINGFPHGIRRGVPRDAPGEIPPPSAVIQPGDVVGFPIGCTFNFVFRNTTDGRYGIGTAGHCTQKGHIEGTLLVKPEEGTIDFANFGRTMFAVTGSPGNDFALIDIFEDYQDDVYPGIRGAEGPCESRPAQFGDPIAQHGHGFIVGAGGQNRYGSVFTATPSVNTYVIAHGAAGGDSGSPIRLTANASDSRLAASGILTHALGLTSLHPSPVVLGPTMHRIDDIIEDKADGGWELVSSPICDDLP